MVLNFFAVLEGASDVYFLSIPFPYIKSDESFLIPSFEKDLDIIHSAIY